MYQKSKTVMLVVGSRDFVIINYDEIVRTFCLIFLGY